MINTVKHVALLKNKRQNEVIEEAFEYWLQNQDEHFLKGLKYILEVTKNENRS